MKKEKREKTGGRAKNTPNILTADLKLWVKNLLEKNQEQFELDLISIDPEKRLNVLTTLLKYAVPSLSSVSVESQLELEYRQLEALLQSAPEAAIEKITEKILTIKNQTNEND